MAGFRLDQDEAPLYARVRRLLEALDLYTHQRAAVLMVMLDDAIPHHHPDVAAEGLPLGACATTAKTFEHALRYLDTDSAKLDREGRDFHVAPLHRPGCLIERVQVPNRTERRRGAPLIREGWAVAKNQFSGHGVTAEVRDLLSVPESEWEEALRAFTAEDEMRARQAKAAHFGERVTAHSPHAELIRVAVEAQLSELSEQGSSFECIYIDDTDGDRVSESEQAALDARGLDFGGNWRYPDALLVNDAEREVWIVDAVTSDGEVDENRAADFVAAFEERGWKVAGFTTAYRSWEDLARRQGGWKNLAYSSNVWIAADGGRFFSVGPARGYDSRSG